MTTAQVVETSVTVNNNSPIQDYVHADDQTQPTFETSNIVRFYMLRPFAHPVACCWMLLEVVAQSLKPVKLLAPLPANGRNNSQHCDVRLHVALWVQLQAPVVQKVDSAIRWINLCPVDSVIGFLIRIH